MGLGYPGTRWRNGSVSWIPYSGRSSRPESVIIAAIVSKAGISGAFSLVALSLTTSLDFEYTKCYHAV